MNGYLIDEQTSILEALKKIDKLSNLGTRILFAVDSDNKVVGSVSDGDCRRGLIGGKSLADKISEVMNTNFTSLKHGEYSPETIQKIRNLGIKYVPELNIDGTLFTVRDFSNGKSYVPVDAVMMAGGKGERLRPLTLDTPKPLLKVADKPIIDYNVENLINSCINHINVTVNYLAEQIEEHFKNPINGVQVKCVHEPKFLGTIGSIKFIREWYNDTILLMNSDLFTNIDIEAFYMHFLKHDADMSVAGVPYNVNIPYGIFELENTRDIKGIIEKPSYHYYANAGIYLIKRDLLDLIPDNEFFDATDFMDKLIKNNKKVIRFPITGYWIDIGKPADFKSVQEFARNINRR
ncbi:nucleotidyltransferase family protein [uncultured Treponema sp.]|uniref:nucleotidyltransferase family protein n=1 Tax=uncultured Treponema sp. TaxID=162155 RepID=UPI0025FA80ED|nr:nucleotidyltransferase family protein [uncultured Treponema sp.]